MNHISRAAVVGFISILGLSACGSDSKVDTKSTVMTENTTAMTESTTAMVDNTTKMTENTDAMMTEPTAKP